MTFKVGDRLHLGCGAKYLHGWVNADGVAAPVVEGVTGHPDVVLDLHHDLGQLPANTLAWVYTSHCLEHCYPDLLPGILRDLYRALQPGGALTIATTDLEGILAHRFHGHGNGSAWESALFGHTVSTAHPLEAHRDCFTYPKLEKLLRAAGFATVRRWTPEQYPEILALNDYAVSCRLVTCFAEGVK